VAENNGGKQHRLKVTQLLADLRSGDEHKIASAIRSFHSHGDATVIAPLVEVWSAGLSDENEARITELFEGLKDTTAIEPLMDSFRSSSDPQMRRRLVSAFWNSKLDFSEYLADFVLFAVEGDFMDAFEAITLIEQFESAVPESAILESQLLLREYFGGNENRDDQKDTIIGDIALIVKQFEEQTDAGDIGNYIE
jgi:hypothetical protein